MHTFPDQSKVLEVSVYDKDFHGKDDFMGKCAINLNNLGKEETHSIWKKLEDGEGSVLLVITISGTLGLDMRSDLGTYSSDADGQSETHKKYVSGRHFATNNKLF